MGTPQFAVPCLARIIQDGYEVAGVFSQPDRPQGRGHKLAPPPVKELALAHQIPVFQPEKLRDGQAAAILKELAPDLIVVVAYGKILPVEILDLPPLGCINVHGSLLPRYRGAAPIQWSVINGDKTTGVTTMYMAEGMDTGDMILKAETGIGPEETAGALYERLSLLGADCLSETLRLVRQGNAPRQPQNHAMATHAPMLEKCTGLMDFTKSAQELYNLVRGCSPWPGAFTYIRGRMLKVHRVQAHPGLRGRPGQVIDCQRFIVACGQGALEFLEVQPQCKGRMSGPQFLCGCRPQAGEDLVCCIEPEEPNPYV